MTYTDPEILYGKLAVGDVGRIAAAADPITGAISAVGRAGQSVAAGTSTAATSWVGAASEKFATRAQLSTTAAKTAGDRLTAGVEIVQAASRAYGQMRSAADNAIGVWRSRPAGLDEEQTRQLANQVNDSLTKVKSGYEGVLRSYAGALGQVKPGFEQTAITDCGWGNAITRAQTPTVPPPGTNPKDVAAWWKSLTPQQQQELLRTKFQELGQLRGLPSAVLDQANRARIHDDKTRFKQQGDDLDAQIKERAGELGIDPNDPEALRKSPELADMLDQRDQAWRKAENADKALSSIAEAEKRAEAAGWRREDGSLDVRVMSWDPYGPRGDGGMAVAYGDPDTAKNLAVCVPGTTSTLNSMGIGQAADLRNAMGSDGTATIQWLGYDAPDLALGEVNDPMRAKEGGPNLVADVDGYRAAGEINGNRQHITVIGHSYGSTTVGYAGMNGLAADDIAFIGSPGVGASNVDQLSVGRGHVYVGAVEHDYVTQGTGQTWFTEDGSSTGPYDPSFGAKQFGTGGETSIWGGSHSDYYKDPESLGNLAKIANGHGDQVTEEQWYNKPTAPELPGSDLPVAGPVIDWGANTVKEGVDIVGDVVHGTGSAIGDVFRGDFDGAGQHMVDTGKEIVNDVGDVVVDTVGKAGEVGRDVYEGGKTVWDNTIGAIF